MAVKSIAPYEFEQKDTVDKFPAPLLYIGWEDHKMFCAPFCAARSGRAAYFFIIPLFLFLCSMTKALPAVFRRQAQHPPTRALLCAAAPHFLPSGIDSCGRKT